MLSERRVIIAHGFRTKTKQPASLQMGKKI